MSDLDEIADAVGTVTDEQQEQNFVRFSADDGVDSLDKRDVQVEYEGGFGTDS